MFQFLLHYYFTYVCLWSLFLSRKSVLKITTKFCILILLLFNVFQVLFSWLCSLLVMLSWDVVVNLGPKKKEKDFLSIFLWNLNGIVAYDHSKLFLLNSCNSLHKFDIICLSETYTDSNTPLDDDNLEHLFFLVTYLIPNAEVSVPTTKTIYF